MQAAARPGLLPAGICRPLESLPGNADTGLRDWEPGYLAVKENGCSCMFAARTTAVRADPLARHDDETDGRSR